MQRQLSTYRHGDHLKMSHQRPLVQSPSPLQALTGLGSNPAPSQLSFSVFFIFLLHSVLPAGHCGMFSALACVPESCFFYRLPGAHTLSLPGPPPSPGSKGLLASLYNSELAHLPLSIPLIWSLLRLVTPSPVPHFLSSTVPYQLASLCSRREFRKGSTGRS